MLKRMLLAGLCAAASLGVLTYGDDRKPHRNRMAREQVMMIFGQRVKLDRTVIPTGLARDRADQAEAQDEHWAAMENEYVQDPRNPVTSSLPNPPGVQLVRTVLNQWRPAPQDRFTYFAALDHDPLSEQYPRKQWWIYVKTVQLRPDGWIADVMVNVRFDMARVTGPGRRPTVHSFWCERYQFQDGVLSYLGGHHGPPLEVFRVPTISVR